MTRQANLLQRCKQQGFSLLAVLSFLARKTSEAQAKSSRSKFLAFSILALVQVARSSYSKSFTTATRAPWDMAISRCRLCMFVIFFFRWRKVNRVKSICLSETVSCGVQTAVAQGLERHLWPVESQELYFARTGPFRLGALFTPRSGSIHKVEISTEFFSPVTTTDRVSVSRLLERIL